ncbi:aminotransferase class V-fold PLP-dependent enzyme [Paenibacillus sp. IHBB 10380]|uniref:aminotransferase class V-fold PLP-dependent enzyme n=1 Tax=Paenibacillus sp. IHBB 10380 TaxID=1566358 RepID=UPI0005CFBE71|nr:aminotransferase class V-fold PLP-dependent enzyme [Paenibacillus sp. IHBB 10380]AJS61321.1 selenocysteine lyase [Paenibacillus sp. IHBB 10380]
MQPKDHSSDHPCACSLEQYFQPFRNHIIGNRCYYQTPYGRKKMIYADYAASGRLYEPIEWTLSHRFGPFVANTHTEANMTGMTMTKSYKEARDRIKRHVNAGPRDVLMMTGSGMTDAINKLQRILGLKVPQWLQQHSSITEKSRPVIFISHMEHHSNQLTWSETIGDVVCIEPGENGEVDPYQLEQALLKYKHRTCKIGSFTACSNVTGFQTPYHQLARIMHEHGGICFVDFSASAPYVNINMHPPSPIEKLDGIFFSPHKFIGGPGSSGIAIFDSRLYTSHVPDHPGGGTVMWSNAWGEHHYFSDIETREDGGTPGFLQTIRAALSIQLKEDMGINQLMQREHELASLLMEELTCIREVYVLGGASKDRLGIVSFIVQDVHYNLMVKLLSDRFGIQVRGGCSCAGPYGHYLLNINKNISQQITDQLNEGNFTHKPGWVRISMHPIMTNAEIYEIVAAIRSIIANVACWKQDYQYNPSTNDWHYIYASYELDVKELFVL